MEKTPVKKPSRLKRLFSRTNTGSAKSPKSPESSVGASSSASIPTQAGFATNKAESNQQSPIAASASPGTATTEVRILSGTGECFCASPPAIEPVQLDLWEEALQTLPEDKQQLLSDYYDKSGKDQKVSERIDGVLKVCQQKRDACLEKRWRFEVFGKTVELRSVADKVLLWLEKFKQIGDVASNADSVHVGLPLAAMRLILEVAVTEKQEMERLLTTLEKVLYLMGRCKVYEYLYLQDQALSSSYRDAFGNLHKAVVQLYGELLGFLARALVIFEKSTGSRFASSFWNLGETSIFAESLTSLGRRVDIEAQNCERVCSSDSRRDTRSAFTELKAVLQDMENSKGLLSSINEQTKDIWNSLNYELRSEILVWISKVPYRDNHRLARERRVKSTGGWLLANSVFEEWKLSDSSMIFWLHGIPGAGKTVLTSNVIDYLLTKQSEDTVVVYFYCDKNQEIRRKPDIILRTFIKQLAINSSNDEVLHKSLVSLYSNRKAEGFASIDLSMQECEDLLVEIATDYNEVFLILDALDESDDSDDKREKFIDCLGTLAERLPRLKIFISSRRDHDITTQLEKETNVGIEASENAGDIAKYVRDAIAKNERKRRVPLPPDLKTAIVERLDEGSDGMFQWAFLQLEELLRLERPSDIRQRLWSLTKGLKATYDEIYTSIMERNDSRATIADRTFRWLRCAARPATTTRLILEAVCQDPETDIIQDVDIDVGFILDACRNLVVFDRHTSQLRFGHLSVREYLEEERLDFTTLQDLPASICLKLLNDPAHYYTVEDDYKCGLDALASYARKYWHSHFNLACSPSPKTKARLKSFLGPFSNSSAAYRNWHLYETYKGDDPLTAITLAPASLSSLAVCRFDLNIGLEEWWDDGKEIITHSNRLGQSLLQICCMNGSMSALANLQKLSVDVNARCRDAYWHGSALATAAAGCYIYIFSKLLLAGANPDVEDTAEWKGSSPLVIAAYRQSTFLDNQLLPLSNVDVNKSNDVLWGTALTAAAWVNGGSFFKYIEHGADVNTLNPPGRPFDTPLIAAIASLKSNSKKHSIGKGPRLSLLNFILSETEASPSLLTNGPFGSALAASAFYGNLEFARILLEKGVDATANLCGTYGNALVAAIATDFPTEQTPAIVSLLLSHHVDVNAKLRGKYGSALVAAAIHGNCLETLLDSEHNVDIEMEVPQFGTALIAAASEGRVDSIKVLLRAGANVNRISGRFRTALVAAVYNGNIEAVHMLIANGADIDIAHSKSSSLLRLAVYRQHEDIVLTLISAYAARATDEMILSPKFEGIVELARKIGNAHIEAILMQNLSPLQRGTPMEGR